MSAALPRTKSALSYYGSDSEVAEQLAGMLESCKHVTIPFVGGGAILPWLKARAIVANDLNSLAINFYRVISGVHGERFADELKRRCANTLSHPSDQEFASWTIGRCDNEDVDCVDAAWAYWALCWIGRKGKGGTKYLGGMPSVRRTANGGTNASRLVAASNALNEWAHHFKRCEWTQDDFRVCIRKTQNSVDCGLYCNPPWVDAGNVYKHRFVTQDHIDLRELLTRFSKTTVIVRYGDDPLIRDLYADWNIIEASSRTQNNSQASELWLTNKE